VIKIHAGIDHAGPSIVREIGISTFDQCRYLQAHSIKFQNLLFEPGQLAAESRKASARKLRHPLIARIGDDAKQLLDPSAPGRRGNAKFGKVSANRVDDRGLLADQQMTRAMKHQATLPLGHPGRHEPHYFMVKYFINNTQFFDWDKATYEAYFKTILDELRAKNCMDNRSSQACPVWRRAAVGRRRHLEPVHNLSIRMSDRCDLCGHSFLTWLRTTPHYQPN